MKRYPKYKESGVPWLGQVPLDWPIVRYKYLFREKHAKKESTLQAGAISFGRVVYKDDEMIPPATKASYQEVLKGEYLINPINLNYDLKSLRTALSEINVCVSPAYIVLQTTIDSEPRYLKYQLHLFDVSHMKTLGAGVRQTISFGDIGVCGTIVPPKEEQTAIASFLDRVVGEIDSTITSQERMIELLKERRSAIVTQAVTRGLDPKAKMKDSGVPWLGQVPAHWAVQKVKHVARVLNGYPFDSKLFGFEGHEIIRIRDIASIETETKYAGEWVAAAEVSKGDVLVGMDGDFNVSSWRGSRALLNQRVCSIRAKDPTIVEFLRWAIVRPLKLLNEITYSTTVKHLSSSELLNLSVAVPPAPEMKAICEFVNLADSTIATAISSQERMIELLKERRSAIITQAVTGQIDVR